MIITIKYNININITIKDNYLNMCLRYNVTRLKRIQTSYIFIVSYEVYIVLGIISRREIFQKIIEGDFNSSNKTLLFSHQIFILGKK